MIKTHQLTRLLLAALLLPALPAWATNLQEAFDAAQRQDPTVQAARLQVDIDNQQRKAARSRLRPSLGAELGTTNGQLHTNLFSRHYYDNRLAGINLSIPVYSPQDAARLQQAQVAELLAQSRLAQALQGLAEQVASSYFAVLSAQDALDVVEAQRHAIQEQFEAAREGFAAGNATITDQQEAQARLDLNRAQLAAARHTLQGRQASFTQLTTFSAWPPIPACHWHRRSHRLTGKTRRAPAASWCARQKWGCKAPATAWMLPAQATIPPSPSALRPVPSMARPTSPWAPRCTAPATFPLA